MAVDHPMQKQQVEHPVFIKAILAAELAFLKAYGENNPDARNVWVRESMFAMQTVKNSTELQKCSLDSIKNAVVNIALTGATLNPALKEADLIARKGVACLDFRYGGLIRIAVDAGAVLSMNAYAVYDCDEFDYDLGKNPPVKYKPSMNPPFDPEKIAKDPKQFWDHIVCGISRAVLPSGVVDWQVLPKWKLLKVRETSMSKNSEYSPWTRWPEEMIRKTVIKYASKTLKGYSRDDRLARAVQLQNDIDGIDPNESKGRDTGAELEKRLNLPSPDAQEPQGSGPGPKEDAFTAEGMSGARLALCEKVGEMTAGVASEMIAVLSSLSGKKINSKEDLLKADDNLVKEMLQKVTGGK